mmetsp:Transcript_52539/g.98503  ORF Transcript_52539/g.98503 Transcript_52539/m.98503 type:complete len:242 (+) Transcript_52539:284-1009(+)
MGALGSYARQLPRTHCEGSCALRMAAAQLHRAIQASDASEDGRRAGRCHAGSCCCCCSAAVGGALESTGGADLERPPAGRFACKAGGAERARLPGGLRCPRNSGFCSNSIKYRGIACSSLYTTYSVTPTAPNVPPGARMLLNSLAPKHRMRRLRRKCFSGFKSGLAFLSVRVLPSQTSQRSMRRTGSGSSISVLPQSQDQKLSDRPRTGFPSRAKFTDLRGSLAKYTPRPNMPGRLGSLKP